MGRYQTGKQKTPDGRIPSRKTQDIGWWGTKQESGGVWMVGYQAGKPKTLDGRIPARTVEESVWWDTE